MKTVIVVCPTLIVIAVVFLLPAALQRSAKLWLQHLVCLYAIQSQHCPFSTDTPLSTTAQKVLNTYTLQRHD
jgi:hypothetical protein